MCGGGGSPPAPPPDYTAEKAKFAADTLAGYQTEADTYNAGVNTFNTNLSNAANSLAAGETAFNNADIYDLYDDPNTTGVNEDVLAGVSSDLKGFDYGSLDASSQDFGDAPIFNPVVNSPWGSITIADMPTLETVNSTLGDDLYDRGQTLSNNIAGLYDERETKYDAFMQEGTALEQAAGALTNSVNRAGLGSDLSGLENTLSDISIDGQNLASSGFYNQSRFGDANQADYISGIEGKIAALDAAKLAELSRISTYETGLNTNVNTLANEAAGLGITDMSRVNEIEAEIARLKREAGQFNSELGFDFSQELGGFSDASNSLAGINADYNAETQRIDDYEADTIAGIRGIRDSAFGTDMYSMGGLNALDQSLADFKTDASGFSSVLPYEVTGLEDYYKTISDRSELLRGNRKTALDALDSRISGVTGGLGDIQLYNEGGFNNASRQLNEIGSDLGQFTGGRVDGIASNIAGGQRSVDAKIQELQAYRSKLEEDMITYLEQIKTGDYYNFEDVSTMRDGVAGKESEVRLYKAKQAMDEITDMIASLDGQDRRLKSDAAAAAERQASSQRGTGFGASSVFGNQNFTPMSTSEYNSFLNSGSEEDPRYSSTPSAFSNALGVIRI
tara:strand:+ start:27846 stop:29705 length:1860 start_codon:yes stop_codon:yes gene_type:complete